MGGHFKIAVHQNAGNLHLRLEGDFNGRSADELLNILEKRCRYASRAFIHTNGLNHIDAIGLSTFHDQLRLIGVGRCWPLDFTGDYAETLAPDAKRKSQ
jgi:anti-anti-sigma regulatory factor